MMNSFLVSAQVIKKIIDKKSHSEIKSEDIRLVLSIAKSVYFESLIYEKIELKTKKKELKITPLGSYHKGSMKAEFREAKIRLTKEKNEVYWFKRLKEFGFINEVKGLNKGSKVIYLISLNDCFKMDAKSKCEGLYWLKLPIDINKKLAGKNPYRAKTILSIVRRVNSINKGYKALKFNYYGFLCEIDSTTLPTNISRFNKQIKEAFDCLVDYKILKSFKLPKIKNIQDAAKSNLFIFFEPKIKPKK